MKSTILALALVITATTASAHSPLNATMPADGEIIDMAPTEIMLDFKGDIRLTRVTVTALDGAQTDVDLSTASTFTNAFTLPITEIGSGAYTVEWRGLGTDGHALNGTFAFTVQ